MSKNSPSPAYLVKGDDPVLLADALRDLVTNLVGDEEAALVVESIDLEDTEVGAVLDACRTPPFLTTLRVVIAQRAGAVKGQSVEQMLAYLADPLESSVLVLVAGGGQTSQKVANAIKATGEVIDAAKPQGRARGAWLTGQFKAAPVVLDGEARQLLDEHLGEDLARLSGILEIVAAVHGRGARVGVAELEPFLGDAGGVAPWDLTDAIDRGDMERAIVHLHRLIEAGGRHPLAVLATLHRHYEAMLRLDGAGVHTEAEAAELLGVKPYPAKKALLQASRVGSAGIGEAIGRLADADLDLRGKSEWPDNVVLEVLVARLCLLARRR